MRDMDFFGSPNYETGRSNTGRSDEATELILRQQSTTTWMVTIKTNWSRFSLCCLLCKMFLSARHCYNMFIKQDITFNWIVCIYTHMLREFIAFHNSSQTLFRWWTWASKLLDGPQHIKVSSDLKMEESLLELLEWLGGAWRVFLMFHPWWMGSFSPKENYILVHLNPGKLLEH